MMRLFTTLPRILALITLLIEAAALLAPGDARAEDGLGLYLGGAVGRSQVNTDGGALNTASFKENHSAWKAIAGLKPIPLIGVEVEYVDFGHPNGSLGAHPADVSMKGAAAFGVLTLPVPIVDLFVKAGLARLQSTVNGTSMCNFPAFMGNCPLFSLSRNSTTGAGGVGVGLKIGAMRIRAEFERFNAAGGNPQLYSVGLTYTFL
jgi:hypothetical protein